MSDHFVILNQQLVIPNKKSSKVPQLENKFNKDNQDLRNILQSKAMICGDEYIKFYKPVGFSTVARETFLAVVEMRDDAVTLGTIQTARGAEQ